MTNNNNIYNIYLYRSSLVTLRWRHIYRRTQRRNRRFSRTPYRQDADIQLTTEIEENCKIPFLDCLITRDNNKLKTTIYREPTHTDRLLEKSSYNPTSHKATQTIRTLTRRAQLVRTITSRTLLAGRLIETLIPTIRPPLALLRQRLYRTSEAPLKLLHVYYNLAIYVLHTNR